MKKLSWKINDCWWKCEIGDGMQLSNADANAEGYTLNVGKGELCNSPPIPFQLNWLQKLFLSYETPLIINFVNMN